MHSFESFLPRVPTALRAASRAALSRFARSEVDFLSALKQDALAVIDSAQSLAAEAYRFIPDGGFDGPPILNELMQACYCKPPFFQVPLASLIATPGSDWVINPRGCAPKGPSPQSILYSIFVQDERSRSFSCDLESKLLHTLGPFRSKGFEFPQGWCDELLKALVPLNSHASMCIFKTFIGGWTTSIRMHEPIKRSCIFGCHSEWDDLFHYLECPALWGISCDALGIEVPLNFSRRLGVVNPTVDSCRALALTFMIYHYTKNEASLLDSPAKCQRAAFESAKTFLNHLK